MNLRLIDYSPALYGPGLQPVRSGKFVQLEDLVEDVETLVLAPYGLARYHAQILERYCRLNDVAGRFVKKPVHYRIEDAGLEVVGGGHWRVDEEARRLVLNGESTAYGPFRPRGLADALRACGPFRGFTVQIG